ncbi:MAG: PKD domain-containing protein, partial [Saprospiraceae bacterium]
MKPLFHKIVAFTLAAMLLHVSAAFAQNFQRVFGTALDNSFTKVVRSGSNYYVIGRDEPSNGSVFRATVTRLNNQGQHQWTLSLNIGSQWNDAVVTPSGNLLVVGNTLPLGTNTESIMGLVTPSGAFSWLRSYNVVGRDAITRIVRNPAPQSGAFPYYALGFQFDPGGNSTWDDVVLLNLNEAGTFNWKKKYAATSDDEYARDLEALPNGDLLFAGNFDVQGVLFRADNQGNIISAAGPEGVAFTFSDVASAGASGFYAVGSSFPNVLARLMKFDNDLVVTWQTALPQLTAINQVWRDNSGDIYVTGRMFTGGLDRSVVMKFQDFGNSAALLWMKYLENGDLSYTGGSSWYLPPSQIAFVDGRNRVNGFGQDCAFMSVSNLELETCMSVDGFVTELSGDYQFFSPVPPEVQFFDTPPAANITQSSALNWQQDNACDTCLAAFTFQNMGGCPTFQFNNTSTGPAPLTYSWNFGDPASGANNTSTATNPNHQFSACGTYTVCLTVTGNGCTASACQQVVVADNVPPTALCNVGVGVILDANCTYTVTPAFVDGGSSDNCPNWTLSVSPMVLTGCMNHTVTLTVTDWCNNTSTCTMGIQTIEAIPPAIVCPPNITIRCDQQLSPFFTGLATATDNCTIKPTITYSDVVTGLMPCDATVARTWVATDSCGNSTDCTQIIRVIDNVAPTISCPQSLSVNTLPGLCYYTFLNFQQMGVTASDNCDPLPAISCTWEDPNGTILPFTLQTQLPKGVNTLRCFARDKCGNVSPTCTFKITVSDNQPPTITCPISLSVVGSLDPQGLCKALLNGIAPTVTDNCPNWTLSYTITGATTGSGTGDASGTMFMQGASTVTYTVTDCGMHTATCSFTVTVICSPGDFPGFQCGQAVMSCFSGFIPSTATADPNGPVLALVDLRQHALAPLGMNWWSSPPAIYHKSTWTAANLGQIFGVTIDGSYNVYASATTMYGRYSPRPNADYGNVYKIDATTGNVSVFATLPQNATSPAGLGDVWYDAGFGGRIFVSNFTDGNISYYNLGGTLLGSYDFPGTTIGTPSAGFVARGERVWAVATHNNRLYFSVWNEDRVNSNPGGFNEIWSVGLSGGTPVLGTEMLEHKMSSLTTTSLLNYSSPVSDIHFSNTGNMLVAERSMFGDIGNSFTAWSNNSHQSRIIELSPTGTWTTERILHVGNAYNTSSTPSYHANSAGGVDYGYESFNPAAMPKPTQCDSIIWGTGDALRFPGYNSAVNDGSSLPCGGGVSDRVYGLAGIRWTGNSNQPSFPNFVKTSSIYIDIDNNLCSSDKTQLGDVDVFDCGCPGGGPSVCDSISVTSMPFNGPQDTCCFKLTLKNDKPNYFTAIQLCAQNGVSISTVSTLNGCVLQGANASTVTIAPTGGIGNYFPVVSAKDFVKFCLSNYQITPTQQIIVKYFGPNFTEVCRDTLIYHCTQKPKCLKITPTVICGPPGSGTYIMNFCIMSDPLIAFNVNSIVLNAPPGYTFTPNTFPVNPTLMPGQMQCGFTTTISGPNAVDGATFCFSLTGKSGPIGTSDLNCCTDTVMLACVTLPDCICKDVSVSAASVSVPGKKCCWELTLTNNYSNTFFSGVQLCSLTPGVVFGCINNNGLPPDWILNSSSTVATLTKFPPGACLGQTEVLPTFCLSGLTGSTQLVEVKWLDKNGKVVCKDTLTFHCEPPEETDCAVIVNPLVVCDLNTPGGYTFSFQVYNNTGANNGTAFNINEVQLTNISGGTMSPTVFPISPAISYQQTSGVLTTSIN